MSTQVSMPSKVHVEQVFENPYMRREGFRIKLNKMGRLNALPPEIAAQLIKAARDPSNGTKLTKETAAILTKNPAALDWRYFRFKRKIFHPLIGGKKVLVTAITPFDMTEMILSRGRRGHQIVGFFHPTPLSVNRRPKKSEWVEALTVQCREREGREPTKREVNEFKRRYGKPPPLGPQKQRWITLLFIPTTTIRGSQEVRARMMAQGETSVIGTKLLMTEGKKIADYDRMEAMFGNVEQWKRNLELGYHDLVHVDLMGESEGRRKAERQNVMGGIPDLYPPGTAEYPRYYPVETKEKTRRFGGAFDVGKWIPIIPIITGLLFLASGLSSYASTATAPTRAGVDVMALGSIVLFIGLFWAYFSNRGSSPQVNLSVGGQMPPQSPMATGQPRQREEEMRRGETEQHR